MRDARRKKRLHMKNKERQRRRSRRPKTTPLSTATSNTQDATHTQEDHIPCSGCCSRLLSLVSPFFSFPFVWFRWLLFSSFSPVSPLLGTCAGRPPRGGAAAEESPADGAFLYIFQPTWLGRSVFFLFEVVPLFRWVWWWCHWVYLSFFRCVMAYFFCCFALLDGKGVTWRTRRFSALFRQGVVELKKKTPLSLLVFMCTHLVHPRTRGFSMCSSVPVPRFYTFCRFFFFGLLLGFSPLLPDDFVFRACAFVCTDRTFPLKFYCRQLPPSASAIRRPLDGERVFSNHWRSGCSQWSVFRWYSIFRLFSLCRCCSSTSEEEEDDSKQYHEHGERKHDGDE